jgi:4'-phosphopantetheinyl transferase
VTQIPPAPEWCLRPVALTLDENEVHVWRAGLDARTVGPALWQLLSSDEQARADRFFFPRDRERFITARGTLRQILATYTGLPPDRLQFLYSSHGKPALIPECGGEMLRSNLTNSHGLALYAVARERVLGVDLEYIRPEVADEPIAERFFAPREVARLRGLPPDQQVEAFFNCWTRKEAYIKAHGLGLSLSLQDFEVSLLPGEPAALLCTVRDPCEAARWSLHSLAPGPGYVGALAVAGTGCRIRCWQWSERSPRGT